MSLSLNLLGIGWGQPGGVPWDFDSIAGLQTFKEGDHLFGEWRDKYPRGQFLIMSPVYRALLSWWYDDLTTVPRAELKVLTNPEHARRFGILIALSDAASALMGAGAVAALYLAALLLFKDSAAAVFAACALAFSQMFVFYSHLGNLDAPTTFWFACATCLGIRAVRTGALRDFILLGITAAWSVCTKDPTAGYVLGLGFAVCIAVTAAHAGKAAPHPPHAWSASLLRLAAASLVFLLCFAVMNDVFFHTEAFLKRMGHWLGGPGVADYNRGFQGQMPLLWQSGRDLYLSLGWPLLGAAAGSTLYCLARFPLAAMFGVLPIVCFYVLVIMNVRMSAPRFFLPALLSLALLVGKGAADWWRCSRVPRVLRHAAVVMVFGLSFLYCLGLDLEMLADTRYDAEAWFTSNVEAGATVAALCPATLAPRLQLRGYQYDWRWGRPTSRDILGKAPADPDYLVLSEKYTENPSLFDPGFRRSLLDGSLGYRVVAEFRNKFLYPRRSLLGLAGWPIAKLSQVSPHVIVLQKVGPPIAAGRTGPI